MIDRQRMIGYNRTVRLRWLDETLDLFLAGMSVNLLPRMPQPSSAMMSRLRPYMLVAVLAFYAAGSATYNILSAQPALTDYSVTLRMMTYGPIVCAVFAAAFIFLAEWLGKIPIRAGIVGKSLLAIEGIGTLTYCLYVFHPEIYSRNAVLLPAMHSLHVSLLHFPSVVLQVFVVASFFYVAVEKPFDAQKQISGTPLLDTP